MKTPQNLVSFYLPKIGTKWILTNRLDLSKMDKRRGVTSTSKISIVSDDLYFGNLLPSSHFVIGEAQKMILAEMKAKAKKLYGILYDTNFVKQLSQLLIDHPEYLIPIIVEAGTVVTIKSYSIRGSHYETSYVTINVPSLKITIQLNLPELKDLKFTELEETKEVSI